MLKYYTYIHTSTYFYILPHERILDPSLIKTKVKGSLCTIGRTMVVDILNLKVMINHLKR